ncbi:MAG: hypothetical protein AB7V46_01395 [Thermomicrobiales bacterium]
MTSLSLAVGNGAEMRLSEGAEVTLTVGGALVAVENIVDIGPGCRGRCPLSVTIFQQGSPELALQWSDGGADLDYIRINAAHVARFHNAVLVRLDVHNPGVATFSMPGEQNVEFRL